MSSGPPLRGEGIPGGGGTPNAPESSTADAVVVLINRGWGSPGEMRSGGGPNIGMHSKGTRTKRG